MSRLIIMGPPGAGKGTQAGALAEQLGVPAISTGDIFRKNIAEETELGIKVKAIIASGQYVPDEVTNELVEDRLAQEDARHGFLLDGYPRTVDQVAALDQMLAKHHVSIDQVLLLTADSETLVARMSARAQSEGRVDDTPEVFRERQRVYTEQTQPLIDIYRERGILAEVDGMGTVEEVRKALSGAVIGVTA